MASIGSFSGLASGVQWQDLIDQIMTIDSARQLDPLTAQIKAQQSRAAAWDGLQGVMQKLADASKALRDGTGFSQYTTAVSGTGLGGRGLVSATAATGAAAGTYQVEVLELARAEKLSGGELASATTALGMSGQFIVNGRAVTVSATDTLSTLRDRINAANTGATPSGVAATVLSTGPNQHRLVLTASGTGRDGIELVDDASGVLRQLGVVSGTATANLAADGSQRTQRFSAVTTAIATLLGVTMPAPSTITVGGRTISVDLATDSLASIAARIQAAGGTAEVVEETANGRTWSRLAVNGAVSAEGADADALASSQRTLEVLGFVTGGREAIAQSVVSQPFTAGGASVTGATALAGLELEGSALGLAGGDSITIRGTRGDGSAVNLSFALAGGETVDDLLARINDATSGFGVGGRPAVATLDAGRIRLTDSQGGDSPLAFALSVTRAGSGEVQGLGGTEVETVGRSRTVVAGSDARLRVDGVLLTRGTNTISDALAGVTLTLQNAEVGTTVGVTVAHDLDRAVKATQDFAMAYNNVLAFTKAQSVAGAPLASNGTLRAAMSSLTNVMLTDVAGLSSATFNRATLAGVSLSRTGTLDVDATALKAALSTNLDAVRALFGRGGSPTDAQVSFVTGGEGTVPGRYAVEITAAATRGAVTGAGFAGVYADDGTPDSITITDAGGKASTVELRNGDTLDAIVARLNADFAARGLRLAASGAGGQLRLEAADHGSAAAFTVAYAGGGTDGSAQLGLAAGSYAGTDVTGTIGGHAATGRGQVLTGAAGTAVAGLAVSYAGTTARSAGEIGFALGVAGMMARVVDGVVRSGDGTVAVQNTSITTSITSLQRRADDVQARLERRRESLVRQFTAMEAAISRMNAQGSWLTSQLKMLQGSDK